MKERNKDTSPRRFGKRSSHDNKGSQNQLSQQSILDFIDSTIHGKKDEPKESPDLLEYGRDRRRNMGAVGNRPQKRAPAAN